MPELPEVELHRRHLEHWLRGRTIQQFVFSGMRMEPRTRRGGLQRVASQPLRGAPRRKGKQLALELPHGPVLLLHLGMTGHLSLRLADEPPPRFTRMSLRLDDGHAVDLRDARRFSRMALLTPAALARRWSLLGPDLLQSPPDARNLRDILGATRVAIKVALMDQSRLAGLGNIHAAEALWHARIHPARPAQDLDLEEARRLLGGIRKTLANVLERDDKEDVALVSEGAANPFNIYAREGEPCPRCRHAVRRMRQGGRSTYLCPVCQR